MNCDYYSKDFVDINDFVNNDTNVNIDTNVNDRSLTSSNTLLSNDSSLNDSSSNTLLTSSNTLSSNDSSLNISQSSNIYHISIKDNDTNIIEDIYLNDKEFKILDTAVKHNRGVVNLLSSNNEDIISNLFRKGLITISNDNYDNDKCINSGLMVVSDAVKYILEPDYTKIRKGSLKDIFESQKEQQDNLLKGVSKVYGNKSISFYCL